MELKLMNLVFEITANDLAVWFCKPTTTASNH